MPVVEVRIGDEELDRAGADVADRLDGSARRVVQDLAHLVADRRRRCLLDDLLVAALDRAVTVADDPARAVGVGHDLHLDVARGRQVGLDEHRGVAERRERLGTGSGELALEVLGVGDDAHAATAATRRCLDQQREVGLLGLGRVDAEDRHAGLVHQLLGADLVAHRVDRVGRRADPGQPGLGDVAGERGVLRQEAVAGVDRVGAGLEGGGDDEVAAEIGVRRRVARQPYGDIGVTDERRPRIGVGVDRDRTDAEVATRTEHPPRDLSAVGNEN